jgi:hypothetical protein
MNRHVIKNFQKAIALSPHSLQEVAWNIGVEREQLDEILKGDRKPTEMQEKEMIRFTFKHRAIMRDDELIKLFAAARDKARKYYRHKGGHGDPEKKQLLIESKQLETQIDNELTSRGFQLYGK